MFIFAMATDSENIPVKIDPDRQDVIQIDTVSEEHGLSFGEILEGTAAHKLRSSRNLR